MILNKDELTVVIEALIYYSQHLNYEHNTTGNKNVLELQIEVENAMRKISNAYS